MLVVVVQRSAHGVASLCLTFVEQILGGDMQDQDAQNKDVQVEAAVFRHLVKHLQEKNKVQNIDLMNLADFCRNCLAKWYVTAASERGIDISYTEAREKIYGMSYQQWTSLYQKPMTEEQMMLMERRRAQRKK